MRITQGMISRMGTEQLFAQRNRLAQTQERAATGKRLNRPSDDPVDYQKTSRLKGSLNQTGQFFRSIDQSRVRLQKTENALADSADVLNIAHTLAIEARNGTNGDEARQVFLGQVESLFDQLLTHANTRGTGGGYIFSGVASDTASFTQSGAFLSGAAPPTVAFTGDPSVIEVEIDQGVFVAVTRNGEQVFQGPVDAFAALGRLWTGIDQDIDSEIDAAIGELEAVVDHVILERAQIGNEGRKAEVFEDRLRLREEELVSNISLLEDADAFEVYTDLATQEAALQASLSVTSRLLTPTLLDFI